jgi:hypothetical protein
MPAGGGNAGGSAGCETGGCGCCVAAAGKGAGKGAGWAAGTEPAGKGGPGGTDGRGSGKGADASCDGAGGVAGGCSSTAVTTVPGASEVGSGNGAGAWRGPDTVAGSGVVERAEVRVAVSAPALALVAPAGFAATSGSGVRGADVDDGVGTTGAVGPIVLILPGSDPPGPRCPGPLRSWDTSSSGAIAGGWIPPPACRGGSRRPAAARSSGSPGRP